MKKKTAKKKTTKKKGKKKTDKRLRLQFPSPDFSHLKIIKDVPMPQVRGAFYWDHLINILDEGDTFTEEIKKAKSFCARARNLGYVVVLDKITENEMAVWFGRLKK